MRSTQSKPTPRQQAEAIVAKIKMREDKEYVMRQLGKYPSDYWPKIMKGYVQQWREGVDSEELQFKKQNAGRVRANTWLRETDHWK